MRENYRHRLGTTSFVRMQNIVRTSYAKYEKCGLGTRAYTYSKAVTYGCPMFALVRTWERSLAGCGLRLWLQAYS